MAQGASNTSLRGYRTLHGDKGSRSSIRHKVRTILSSSSCHCRIQGIVSLFAVAARSKSRLKKRDHWRPGVNWFADAALLALSLCSSHHEPSEPLFMDTTYCTVGTSHSELTRVARPPDTLPSTMSLFLATAGLVQLDMRPPCSALFFQALVLFDPPDSFHIHNFLRACFPWSA